MKIIFDTTSLESYRQFLAVKRLPHYRIQGREAWFPDEYAALLHQPAETPQDVEYTPPEWFFDYQKAMMPIVIRKRKYAIFWDCGMGKTPMFFEFARVSREQMSHRKGVLICSPLNVIEQTSEESRKFYGDALGIEQVHAAQLGEWLHNCHGKIGITNYESLRPELEQGQLGSLILDECFAPGTPVDCVDHTGIVQRKIEDVRNGDMIRNAFGDDTVAKIKRREVSHAYVVTAGKRITCSPNHPFFTRRGWVLAQDLEPGDSILSTAAAVRMVRHGVYAEGHMGLGKVLRSILLSEMADETTGTFSEGSHAGDASQDRGESLGVVQSWIGVGEETFGAYSEAESFNRSRSAQENLCKAEVDELRTFRAWWKRDRLDCSTEDLAGCSWRELEGGIVCIAGPAEAGISHLLQARLGERRTANQHRSGWTYTPLAEGDGCEAGCDADFVRVESLEVLELGHPELERLRDADGKLYFYDLEATRHPSFSVNGLLVHNSSILKSHYGKWGQILVRLGRGIDWKLCCTGTPAPNDRIEYANHAVFLDQFSSVNGFLATFFVNRGQTQERWVLKPHALKPFYKTISHWCHFLSDPRVYGWHDNADTIPPIHVHIHDVPMTQKQKTIAQNVTGELFAANMGGITRRGKLGQLGKGFYNGEQVGSNKPEFIRELIDGWINEESTIVWCLYNAEQDHLAKVLPRSASIDGSTPYEKRMEYIRGFKSGEIRTLISKPKILGLGLNLQVATRQVFSGLADSFESYFQAVKRSNRYGSTKPLNVHIPVTDIEEPMVQNVLRKAHLVQEDTAEQERLFKELSNVRTD